MTTNTVCLNNKYSTTSLVTEEKPEIINNHTDKFESVLLLVGDENRKGEGGLRTHGYFKKSYDDKPLVSVITVVYNGKDFLEETILSVINQSYDNVEYIIIDGGSSDGSVDIIKKYEERVDYWVSERDSGIYDAINKGIRLCNGEIIGIVNADDYLYIDSLKKIANIFQEKELMFTYGVVDLMNKEGKVFDTAVSIGKNNFKYRFFKHMPYLHPTIFIRAEVYKKLGLYSTEYKLSSDYDFTLKLAFSDLENIRLDFPTGVFRLGGQSGGTKSYIENHNLLISHNVNPIIVYLNTFILFFKMYLRKILSR